MLPIVLIFSIRLYFGFCSNYGNGRREEEWGVREEEWGVREEEGGVGREGGGVGGEGGGSRSGE